MARPLLLLAPLLLPRLGAFAWLPPGIAYLATEGAWLVALGAGCAWISLALAVLGWQPTSLRQSLAAGLGALSPRAFAASLWTVGFVAILLLIPGHRLTGDSLGGDEPKYLRLAESLYRDLDVDIGSESQATLTPRRLAANIRALAASVWVAGAELGQDAPVPAEHQWNRGNWTLAGRSGGLYYIQSPGLPLLLLPGLIVQRTLLPDRTDPLFPFLTLAALWATALLQATLLVFDLVGSRLAALVAAAALCVSAPVLVGGYHFYPEVAAAAAVPWLLRHALQAGPRPGRLHAAAVCLVAGALVWLHPKFLPLSLTLLFLLLFRLRRAWLAALGALPLLALLLFDHHITGLLQPDAFYRRYGSEVYAGASSFLTLNMLRGALNALVAARDGLLIMAPVAVAGVLALPLLFREQRQHAVALAAVFASLWLVAAVHNGGAPGPPGRLMAPVACVLGAPLCLGLLRLRAWLGYRWTTGLLLILTGLITVTMIGDRRRSVKPYRSMAGPGINFARDLPGGPPDPGDPPSLRRRGLEIARGATLVAILGFWVWACGRRSPAPAAISPASRWRAIRNTHLAWWGSVWLASTILRALGP